MGETEDRSRWRRFFDSVQPKDIVTIVTVAISVGTLFVAIRALYVSYTAQVANPAMSFERDYMLQNLRSVSDRLRDNFTQMALDYMGMKRPHQTQILRPKTVEKGKRCANLYDISKSLQHYLMYMADEPDPDPEEVSKDAGSLILMARVVVMGATANSSVMYDETLRELEAILQMHDNLADNQKEEYLKYRWKKYSKALLGQFYLERARYLMSLDSLDKPSIERWLNESQAAYTEAIDLNRKDKEKSHGDFLDPGWTSLGSALMSINEWKLLFCGLPSDEDFYNSTLEFIRQEPVSSDPPRGWDPIGGKLAQSAANIVEAYIVVDSLSKAIQVADTVMEKWYGDAIQNQMKLVSREEQPRMIYDALVGLRLCARALEALNITDSAKVDSVCTFCKTEYQERELAGSDYIAELSELTMALLEIHTLDCTGRHDSAEVKLTKLSYYITENYLRWVGPASFSKPRFLLREVTRKILQYKHLPNSPVAEGKWNRESRKFGRGFLSCQSN
ncbi:MAG TPA: hypothetical protein PK186_09495 [candidate division Zixibacteria bacterium]|nr:hypothetical protein [candidate division Zixibacteria bacterium]